MLMRPGPLGRSAENGARGKATAARSCRTQDPKRVRHATCTQIAQEISQQGRTRVLSGAFAGDRAKAPCPVASFSQAGTLRAFLLLPVPAAGPLAGADRRANSVRHTRHHALVRLCLSVERAFTHVRRARLPSRVAPQGPPAGLRLGTRASVTGRVGLMVRRDRNLHVVEGVGPEAVRCDRLAQPDSEVVVGDEVAGDRHAHRRAAGEDQHPGRQQIRR